MPQPLSPQDEAAFQRWYAQVAAGQGLDPNPDAPEHHYDYRGAFQAGALPDEGGHWPSRFKAQDHPNRFINGVDTITDMPVQARIVEVPGVGEVEFPGEMSDQDVLAAIQKLTGATPPTEALPQTTPWENVKQFGANAFNSAIDTFGGLVEGVASAPGAIRADPLGSVTNFAMDTVAQPLKAVGRLYGAMARDPESVQGYFENPTQAVLDVASMVGMGGIIGRLGNKALTGAAVKGYPLKGNFPTPEAQRAAIVAGLKEGINPLTTKGRAKTASAITRTGQARDAVVDDLTQQGVVGRIEPILKAGHGELKAALDVPEGNPGAADIIRERLTQVATGPTFSQALPGGGRQFKDIPLDKLEILKEKLQGNIKSFNEAPQTPRQQIERALEAATRGQINQLGAGTDLAKFNQHYGALADLNAQLNPNIIRAGNQAAPLMAGAAGAALTGHPAGAALAVAANPTVRGRVAYPMAQGAYNAAQWLPRGSTLDPAVMTALAALMQDNTAR